jgi:hydroxymethylglutaryl-CoA lyase
LPPFDAAIKGFGGCPMAGDELTGNLATEIWFHFCKKKGQLVQ